VKEQPSEPNKMAITMSCLELKKATATAKKRSEFKKAIVIMKAMQSRP
jgi:hypothetical protein